LHADAQAAAAAAGYDSSSYDIVVVIFTNLGDLPGSLFNGWAGLSDYYTRVWGNGEVVFGVVAHELGHCFCMHPAALLQTTDGNPISDNGILEQYGDVFDTMSYGNDTRTDFNPYFKRQINWIDDTQIQTVTNSGVYRVHRIDGPTAVAPVALKVAKDN